MIVIIRSHFGNELGKVSHGATGGICYLGAA